MKTFILILLIILISKFTFSQSLFDTNFHEINFISNNVENDKTKKITLIKFESINKIFSNILIKEDYNYVIRNINEDLINVFIKNIIIEDEKIINNNYSSKIKINFNKKRIVNYLRKNNFSYVEYVPDGILTIIYENNKLSNNLFSQNNLHYSFLLNNNILYPFYVLPKLDLNDRFILNGINIENKNKEKIKNFINKYNKNEAVIIISKKNINDIKYSIYLFSDNNFIQIDEFNFYDYNYSNLFKNLENNILNHWKINNKIDNTIKNSLECEINYFNLLELKEIKINLNSISSINNIELKTISLKKNNYNIHFYGDKKFLPKLFNLNNLDIKYNNSNCKVYLK